MALNPLGRRRLADAYCERGEYHQKDKQFDAAIADYEKSIDAVPLRPGVRAIPTIR
jgi:hypothetical protein